MFSRLLLLEVEQFIDWMSLDGTICRLPSRSLMVQSFYRDHYPTIIRRWSLPTFGNSRWVNSISPANVCRILHGDCCSLKVFMLLFIGRRNRRVKEPQRGYSAETLLQWIFAMNFHNEFFVLNWPQPLTQTLTGSVCFRKSLKWSDFGVWIFCSLHIVRPAMIVNVHNVHLEARSCSSSSLPHFNRHIMRHFNVNV